MLSGARELLRYAMAHPLGGKRPFATFWQILKWQVASRLSNGPIIHAWVNDSKLVVRRNMFGATGNVYFGLHEFADMAFFLHGLREGDLFLDIGANVGTYTVLASKVCKARTWAFEPDAMTIANLEANIIANEIGDLATIQPTALGAENGEIAFTVGLDAVNRVSDSPDLPQHLVAVRKLDDVVGDEAPVMIKIDVEGHEEQVLVGAEAVLAKPSLLAIEIETLTPAIEATLLRHGFVQRFYDPFSRHLSAAQIENAANNRLYIRGAQIVEDRLRTAKPFRVAGFSI